MTSLRSCLLQPIPEIEFSAGLLALAVEFLHEFVVVHSKRVDDSVWLGIGHGFDAFAGQPPGVCAAVIIRFGRRISPDMTYIA